MTITIKELQESKESIYGQLSTLKDAVGDDETFSDEQMKQWDDLSGQFADVSAKIDTRERLLSLDGQGTKPGQQPGFQPRVTGRQSRNLDAAVRGWALNQIGRGHEATDVMTASRETLSWDEPIHGVVKWDQTKGVPEDGGHSVNEAVVAGVIRRMKDFGGMFEACHVFSTTSGAPLKKIIRDSTNFRAVKTSELGSIADQTRKQDKATFGATELTSGIYQTSRELVRDSAFDLLGEFQADVAESLSRGSNFYLSTGAAADEPQGVEGAVAPVAGLNALSHDNILKLFHSVDASYRRSNRCAFMCNDNTILAMKLALKDADGRPLYKMEPNAVGGFDYVIEGKRVRVNPDLSDGNLLFGDFGKYHIRLIGGVSIMILRELFALTGGIGIIGHSAIDGRLVDNTAIKKLVFPAA